MKKLFLSLLLIGTAAGAYAQGLIAVDNNGNSNPSTAATSGGLFFLGTTPINSDFNVTLLGGTDSTALSVIATLAGQQGVTAFGNGTFTDQTGNTYPVPGTTTASTTAFFQIQAWTGSAASYAAAVAAGAPNGISTIFANGVAAAPTPTPDLTGMPAVIIAVPEPSSFALAGLGAAALLIFRRRK
jgi:hypothetical protein